MLDARITHIRLPKGPPSPSQTRTEGVTLIPVGGGGSPILAPLYEAPMLFLTAGTGATRVSRPPADPAGAA